MKAAWNFSSISLFTVVGIPEGENAFRILSLFVTPEADDPLPGEYHYVFFAGA
ncbi:MAG: hypothetical protein IKO11_08500 [Lachnospiraceae bacterium]|nr:hypothetical protein [Lachnospiraceae bacterium]